jgi:hypothetical protein
MCSVIVVIDFFTVTILEIRTQMRGYEHNASPEEAKSPPAHK